MSVVSVLSSNRAVVANNSVEILANQASGTATLTPAFTALAAKKSVTLSPVGSAVKQVINVYPEVLPVAAGNVQLASGTMTATGVVDLFDTGNPKVVASAFSATSNSPYATIVPNSFVVAGNRVRFRIQVSGVTSKQVATITVTGLGYTQTTRMTITP